MILAGGTHNDIADMFVGRLHDDIMNRPRHIVTDQRRTEFAIKSRHQFVVITRNGLEAALDQSWLHRRY
jgi:hypothetical protein